MKTIWELKPMEKDANGKILLLKNLNVSQALELFTAYIRHGIPHFYTMKHNAFSKNLLLKS